MTIAHNGGPELSEDEKRTLFVRDKNAFKSAKEKVDLAVSALRNVRKTIKADGFTAAQVIAAIAMESTEGEEKIRSELVQTMWAARAIGVAWGSQLEMFEAPDRTPAVDKAHEDGKVASMENKPRRAPYAPETEQAREWYAGYDEHQEQLARGFKPLHEADVSAFQQRVQELAPDDELPA